MNGLRPLSRAGPRRGRVLPSFARSARAAARAWLLGAALAGCSSPGPLTPQTLSAVRLEGRAVVWTSARPALGAARWGTRRGDFDRVAYPAAGDDAALVTSHRVPLLGAVPGESVFVQPLTREADGSLVAGTTAAFLLTAATPESILTWTMLDVGFGDAHLLAMPVTGRHVLIDAGERRDAANVARALGDAGIVRLDAVLATHAHEDHIGGFVGSSAVPTDGVLERFEVGVMLEGPPPSAPRSAYAEMVAVCAARAIPRAALASGDDDASATALDWDPAVRVRVLHAGGGRALGGETESDWINDDSIVLRITFGTVSAILGGDAESPVATALLGTGTPLAASMFKVHHHGASDASDPSYLDAVHPRAALIPIVSYEATSGSLPSGIVLERLRQRAIDIFANDRAEPLALTLHGDAGQHVEAITDGRSYEIRVVPSVSLHWPPDHPALPERSPP